MLAVELMFRNDWQVARKLVWGESIPSAVRRNLRAPREVNREEDWKCIFWGLAARSDLRGTITLYAPDPRIVGRLSYRCRPTSVIAAARHGLERAPGQATPFDEAPHAVETTRPTNQQLAK